MTWPLSVHILLSDCGPLGAVPDAVCSVVGGVASVTEDVAEVIQNPFRWLYHHTLGIQVPQGPQDPGWAACEQDWTQPSCPKVIDSLKPGSLTLQSEWPRLYAAFAVSGVFVAATACVVRLVRGVFDERVAGMHLVADSVVRLTIVAGALLAPTPDHSLLLTVLTWCTSASGALAESAAAAITGAFNTNLDLGAVLGNIAGAGLGVGGIGNFLIVIPVLLAAVGFVYMLALYLLRVIQLVFAVATAPLFIGVAAYDVRSRFVQWWVDLFTSAMVLPVVLSVCGSLTGAVALTLLGTHPGTAGVGNAVEQQIRTMLACFALLGGVWMTGKAVHGLAWRGFSHGGITGAVTALSTSVMALPNLAGNASAVMRMGRGASVLAPRRQQVGANARATDAEVLLGAAAAGHAASLSSRSADSHVPTGVPGADFSAQPAAAGVVRSLSTRDSFNSVVSAAVAGYATSAAGRADLDSATGHLVEGGAGERVEEYTRMVARDPVVGNAVAGAAVAALLHNQVPNVAPILRGRGTARP